MPAPASGLPRIIAPSLLSCDFANLEAEIRRVEDAGADWLHVDVMDGHFVPNLTIGPPVVRAIKRVARVPLDVHLMITHPLRYADAYLDAGADYLTAHVEASEDAAAFVAHVRSKGGSPGLSVSPPTDVEALLPFLDDIDLALVMTVNPGFGGQAFMPACMPKIRAIRQRRGDLLIEVDGGIDAATAPVALGAGATVLVAGSYVFGAASGDYAEPIRALRQASPLPSA